MEQNQLAKLPIAKVDTLAIDLIAETEIATELLAQAARAEITDVKTYGTGGDLIKIAETNVKRLEVDRKKLTTPFFEIKKFIDAQYKIAKDELGKVRTTIGPKMLAWKKEEDERLRVIAAAEAKRIEDEALAAAEASSEEEQDEVMDTAAEAADKMVDNAGVGQTYGNYGSSTGTQNKYSTEVINKTIFLREIIAHIDSGNPREIDLDDIVDLRVGGLNRLAKRMRGLGVKKMQGANFNVEDSLRVR